MKIFLLALLIPIFVFASYFREGIVHYKQKNFEAALEAFKNAASQENSKNAYYFLGLFYLKGLGTQQDLDKAEKYLQIASSFGNERANCLLAEVIILKYKDYDKAKKILISGKKSGAYECKQIAKKYKIKL